MMGYTQCGYWSLTINVVQRQWFPIFLQGGNQTVMSSLLRSVRRAGRDSDVLSILNNA